ncbi:hypothetical protein VPH35_120708 [Triticum aestivum]
MESPVTEMLLTDYKRCARQLFDKTTMEEKKTRLRRKEGMCNLQKFRGSPRKVLLAHMPVRCTGEKLTIQPDYNYMLSYIILPLSHNISPISCLPTIQRTKHPKHWELISSF